jgi:hypothetical protein
MGRANAGSLLVGALAAGCYSGVSGEVGPGGASSSAGASDSAASAGDDEGGSDDGDDEPAACGEAGDLSRLGPSPLQRLTRLEYDRVALDLLGDDSHPASILPDDDRVGSFASNSITHAAEHTVALYAQIAESLAERAVADVETLVGCDPAEGIACAESFVVEFGRRAYRRPLRAEEVDRLLAVFDQGENFANGIRLVLEAILQSPHFLYRIEEGVPTDTDHVVALTSFELASRLSFFLWKSMPDAALLDAAESGDLDTADGLRTHADRLLADPRSMAAVQAFHEQWLGLDGPHGLESTAKDTTLFPAYTDSLEHAMLDEVRTFVRHVFENEGASLRTLLTARYTFANAELAALYGIDGVTGDAMQKIDLDPTRRIGLLTQAGVLATRAGFSQTSPTLRGKLVRNEFLCDTVPPPPPNVNDVLPPQEEGQTKKEQLEAHVSDPACAGCHVMLDQIGFGFEHYDPIGAFRTADGELDVDATGDVISGDEDIAGAFEGAIELAERLASSDSVARCVARQWSRFALGRDVPDDEAECVVERAYVAFDEADRDLRRLMIEIVMLDSFRHRRVPSEEG